MTTTSWSTSWIFHKVVKCKYHRNYSSTEQTKMRFEISDQLEGGVVNQWENLNHIPGKKYFYS